MSDPRRSEQSDLSVNDSAHRPGPWWDWRLLGVWIAVNASAYVVIVLGGVTLEQLASGTTKDLAEDHRLLAVLLIALIGAAFQGFVQGRWQWRILVRRMPGLPRRRWVIATLCLRSSCGCSRLVRVSWTRWHKEATPSPRSRTGSFRHSSSDP
jgi:hypothetical protein